MITFSNAGSIKFSPYGEKNSVFKLANAVLVDESSASIAIADIFKGVGQMGIVMDMDTMKKGYDVPGIVEVMHKGTATIIKWADGTKTCAVCGEGENFDPYTGFMAAVVKKLFGSTGKAKALHKKRDFEGQKQAQIEAEKLAEEKKKEERAKWEAENAEKIAARKAKAEQKREKRLEDERNRRIDELTEMYKLEMIAEQRAREMLEKENGDV